MFDAILVVLVLSPLTTLIVYLLVYWMFRNGSFWMDLVRAVFCMMLCVLFVSGVYFVYPEMGNVGISLGLLEVMLTLAFVYKLTVVETTK